MNLWEYEGKNIKVTFVNGRILAGEGVDHTSALNNTGEVHNGVETLCIGNVEFSSDEVETIEVLN